MIRLMMCCSHEMTRQLMTTLGLSRQRRLTPVSEYSLLTLRSTMTRIRAREMSLSIRS